eukprot:SAG31_NODE_4291_length_3376_cov_1.344522_2_plen_294_part_00
MGKISQNISQNIAKYISEYIANYLIIYLRSPPGFYFRPGRGADKTNFILWSHGGGWCRNEGECAGRALTYEGSSARNPPDGPPRQNMDKGIMSSDCGVNPFCNWTVAYFIYCDGGSWTGDRDQPVPTSQAEYADPPVPAVHFKGRRNLQAIMDTLKGPSFGLGAATKVIYAGASAGGLTTYLHCDAVAAMLPASDVRCLGKDCYFLVFVQLFEKDGTLIERNTALIEKVSALRGRRILPRPPERDGGFPVPPGHEVPLQHGEVVFVQIILKSQPLPPPLPAAAAVLLLLALCC